MIFYPIEEQLERIHEEVKQFSIEKPVEEMTEEEIKEAETEASKYVDWVEDEEYIQLVPMVKKTKKMIYPI